MTKLDEIDIHILNSLQENSRKTVKELSAELELSASPTFERIKKLEKAGFIKGYTAIIDADMLGKKLYAFAHISLKEHSKDAVNEFTASILAIPQIMECHYTSGDSDFIIKILVENMDAYRDFILTKLFEMSNIGKVETYLSLSVVKNTNAILLR